MVACNKFTYFDVLSMPPKDSQELIGTTQRAPQLSSLDTNMPSLEAYGPPSPKSHRALHASSTRNLPPQYTRVAPERMELDQPALSALTSAIMKSPTHEEDSVNLAEVGNRLPRISPDLIPRNYGFERVEDFVKASGIIDLRMKAMGSNPPIALICLKEPIISRTV